MEEPLNIKICFLFVFGVITCHDNICCNVYGVTIFSFCVIDHFWPPVYDNFNLNFGVKYKSVQAIQKQVHVYLNINQSILHMRQAEVREPAEEPLPTFDLEFC